LLSFATLHHLLRHADSIFTRHASLPARRAQPRGKERCAQARGDASQCFRRQAAGFRQKRQFSPPLADADSFDATPLFSRRR
jgi:hypothetical protein